jgi:GntP family gluconate:H+ symporter
MGSKNAARSTVALALSISAGHGLLALSPVPIAAAAILGASLWQVLLLGVPAAIVSAVIGVLWLRLLPAASADVAPSSAAPTRTAWPLAVLLLATLVPLVMLMVRSLGDMPSEPFGGGASRELLLGLGRPLTLLLVGVVIAIVGFGRIALGRLREPGWTGSVIARVAETILIVGAAGGLQGLCQESDMAELLGEKLLAWHAGLLVPFLVAATIKTLQGSSQVAVIAAAGIVQPSLAALGLGGDSGAALAALAAGAGAMTLSHVNDEFFWLVVARAGLSPLRAIAAFSVATLVQGVAAVATLLLLSLLVL